MSRPTPSIIVPFVLLSVLVLLPGCGGSTGSALASHPAASPASVASERPSQVPAEPATRFTWPDGDRPSVSRAMTGLDEAYINPGAVIDTDGTLHMYANVFTDWPGEMQVMHLTSTDGVDWTLAQADPVLVSTDVPFARPGFDVSTGFIAPDGSWVLVFETTSIVHPWEIGIATAPGPDGPWTVAPTPVLSGTEGAWDAGGLAWPSVVATDEGFAMYYSAFATNPRETVIARATSSDGLAWTKGDGPVFVPAARWERAGIDRPRVVPAGDRYVMVYSGSDLTDRGVAFSQDGIDWERDGGAPAIQMEGYPVDGRAWDAALVHRHGVLTYYLEIGVATATTGTEIYRATAPLP